MWNTSSLFASRGVIARPQLKWKNSVFIPTDEYVKLFRSIWDDVRGASLKHHPAPFPEEIAARLIRMFSFVGDTVLDPFGGTGTTALAALKLGRSSITYEIEPKYIEMVRSRIAQIELFEPNLIFASSAPAPFESHSVIPLL